MMFTSWENMVNEPSKTHISPIDISNIKLQSTPINTSGRAVYVKFHEFTICRSNAKYCDIILAFWCKELVHHWLFVLFFIKNRFKDLGIGIYSGITRGWPITDIAIHWRPSLGNRELSWRQYWPLKYTQHQLIPLGSAYIFLYVTYLFASHQ